MDSINVLLTCTYDLSKTKKLKIFESKLPNTELLESICRHDFIAYCMHMAINPVCYDGKYVVQTLIL